MKEWLENHIEYPYATKEEKIYLATQTNLEVSQVDHWLIRARSSLWFLKKNGNQTKERYKRWNKPKSFEKVKTIDEISVKKKKT